MHVKKFLAAVWEMTTPYYVSGKKAIFEQYYARAVLCHSHLSSLELGTKTPFCLFFSYKTFMGMHQTLGNRVVHFCKSHCLQNGFKTFCPSPPPLHYNTKVPFFNLAVSTTNVILPYNNNSLLLFLMCLNSFPRPQCYDK